MNYTCFCSRQLCSRCCVPGNCVPITLTQPTAPLFPTPPTEPHKTHTAPILHPDLRSLARAFEGGLLHQEPSMRKCGHSRLCPLLCCSCCLTFLLLRYYTLDTPTPATPLPHNPRTTTPSSPPTPSTQPMHPKYFHRALKVCKVISCHKGFL